MPDYSQKDVFDAFNRMLNARDAVVEQLRLTDPDRGNAPIGSEPQRPGASEEKMRELEAHFGLPFPPSFKHFLRAHDGSPWADLGSDLFSVDQIIEFDTSEKSRFFSRNLARVRRDTAEPLLVFAASRDRNITVMFESDKPDEFGEWPTIYLSKREKVLLSHADFVQFMVQATENLEYGLSLYAR